MWTRRDKPPDTWQGQVSDDLVGQSLSGFLVAAAGVSWGQAKRWITSGKVRVDGVLMVEPGHRVGTGQRVEVSQSARRQPKPGPTVTVLHDDPHLVVIEKPHGVSTVPYHKREQGTAMDLVRDAWRRMGRKASRSPLLVVHRIDKDTSGLVVFAKSKPAELGVGAQFRAHTVERRYLCVAHGNVGFSRVESRLIRDRGDGLRGSTRVRNQGKRAVTHVEVLERLGRATVCSVRLETGKTHQIRIHMAERGCPLIGETVYIRDHRRMEREEIESDRLLLHAETLGFEHPITNETLRFASRGMCFDLDALRRRLG